MEKVHVSTKMHSHCCRNLFYDNCIMYRKYEIPYLIWLYIPVYSLQACWSLYSVWNCSLYEWQTICVKWPRVVKKSKHVCCIVQVLHKRLIYMHKKYVHACEVHQVSAFWLIPCLLANCSDQLLKLTWGKKPPKFWLRTTFVIH